LHIGDGHSCAHYGASALIRNGAEEARLIDLREQETRQNAQSDNGAHGFYQPR
jgi:hypothetical protein